MDTIHFNSGLSGFDGVLEFVSNPVLGSLSGWAITQIDQLDKTGVQYMDGALAFIATRILAVALPILSLLDCLSIPREIA